MCTVKFSLESKQWKHTLSWESIWKGCTMLGLLLSLYFPLLPFSLPLIHCPLRYFFLIKMAFAPFSFYAFLLFPGRLWILIQHPSLLKHQWLISPSAVQKDTPFFRDAVTSHSQIQECEQNVSGIHRPCYPICLIPSPVSCLQVPHNHSAFWVTSGTLSPSRYWSPKDSLPVS